MRYYPCFILTKTELKEQAQIQDITFKNGHLVSKAVRDEIENYISYPIVTVQPSAQNPDEILVFFAEGTAQYNPTNKQRTIVIEGDLESLKVILSDIIKDRPGETIEDIFYSYTFKTPKLTMVQQLYTWLIDTYK